VVCHGHRADDIAAGTGAFGVLIPRSEQLRCLGTLFSDSIFPGQAPRGHHMLRTMVGGAHDQAVVELSDDELDQVVRADLHRALGVKAMPPFRRVYRHPQGIAQYTIGHEKRVAATDRLAGSLPGLVFTGASYRGVSVNGCIKDAFRLSHQLWELLHG